MKWRVGPGSGGEGGGEVRGSVALDELEAADRVPALGSLLPSIDFYERIV
jgi:hypothetical protein